MVTCPLPPLGGPGLQTHHVFLLKRSSAESSMVTMRSCSAGSGQDIDSVGLAGGCAAETHDIQPRQHAARQESRPSPREVFNWIRSSMEYAARLELRMLRHVPPARAAG